MESLIARLRQSIGPESVLTGGDATRRMAPGSRSSVLLLPRDTEDVSRVLALCHQARRPVVAQGGLTGLVHGAVCGVDEVALAFDRMRRIEEVDVLNRCLTAQAGVPLQAAQEAAEEVGLMVPVDLGARGSATVGGTVATNAGGTRVLRFGMMREAVLGLEAVLADGTVVDSRGKMLKNNAGYDLKHLFIGSEGTLGLVTRVVLRLRPLPRGHHTALVAVDGFERLARFLGVMEASLQGELTSFEVMWRSFYDLMTTPPSRGRPILPAGCEYYVLVETMGPRAEEGGETLLSALAQAQAQGLLAHSAVATSAAQRREMWSLREELDPLKRTGPVFSYDVSLPLDAMEDYVARVKARLAERFGAAHHCHVFGHLADGNLHLSIGAGGSDAHGDVDDIVYGTLERQTSSVSAEHGIGLLKKGHLWRSRSEAELAVMRVLKHALDPHGILNPGKVFELHRPE